MQGAKTELANGQRKWENIGPLRGWTDQTGQRSHSKVVLLRVFPHIAPCAPKVVLHSHPWYYMHRRRKAGRQERKGRDRTFPEVGEKSLALYN